MWHYVVVIYTKPTRGVSEVHERIFIIIYYSCIYSGLNANIWGVYVCYMQDGWSVMMAACRKESPGAEVLNELLKAGGDPNAGNHVSVHAEMGGLGYYRSC